MLMNFDVYKDIFCNFQCVFRFFYTKTHAKVVLPKGLTDNTLQYVQYVQYVLYNTK